MLQLGRTGSSALWRCSKELQRSRMWNTTAHLFTPLLVHAAFASAIRLFPLALTASTYSITKWWCWYFDDQFMSGWAGPCVWTHFHRFLLKTVQSFQSNRGVGVPRLWAGKKKQKKTGAVHNGFREEKETGREMYQKAFLSEPTSRHHLRKVSR